VFLNILTIKNKQFIGQNYKKYKRQIIIIYIEISNILILIVNMKYKD